MIQLLSQSIPMVQSTIPLICKQAISGRYVSAVLVAQHTDNSFVAYSGCYALGNLPPVEWGIVNGQFTLLAETVPTTLTIMNALGELDCAQLEMGL